MELGLTRWRDSRKSLELGLTPWMELGLTPWRDSRKSLELGLTPWMV